MDTNRKEKQQFWKRLGIGCRTLGKMTLDTAVKNRSVIIEVRFIAIYFLELSNDPKMLGICSNFCRHRFTLRLAVGVHGVQFVGLLSHS